MFSNEMIALYCRNHLEKPYANESDELASSCSLSPPTSLHAHKMGHNFKRY
jgi:hypothetical protein